MLLRGCPPAGNLGQSELPFVHRSFGTNDVIAGLCRDVFPVLCDWPTNQIAPRRVLETRAGDVSYAAFAHLWTKPAAFCATFEPDFYGARSSLLSTGLARYFPDISC